MGDALHGRGIRVISEADASGVIRREYIWLGDRIVGTIDGADTTSPNLYYVVNDYLDRPIRMRDANHVDVWKAAYRPFGEAIVTGSAGLDAHTKEDCCGTHEEQLVFVRGLYRIIEWLGAVAGTSNRGGCPEADVCRKDRFAK